MKEKNLKYLLSSLQLRFSSHKSVITSLFQMSFGKLVEQARKTGPVDLDNSHFMWKRNFACRSISFAEYLGCPRRPWGYLLRSLLVLCAISSKEEATISASIAGRKGGRIPSKNKHT